MTLTEVMTLALELSRWTCTASSGRKFTLAERAVILSTYVRQDLGPLAIVLDAMRLELYPGLSEHLEPELEVAEARLANDESGIAFLPPHHAAHIFVTRFLELHP